MQLSGSMSSQQAIRDRLLQRRASLLARYRDELERADEQHGVRDPENAERAAEEWDARVLSQLGETDAAAIASVVDALRRLDGGTYGTCTVCAESISQARLTAVPEAATCIRCARTHDRSAAIAH
jgi:DnaK suppressor protein